MKYPLSLLFVLVVIFSAVAFSVSQNDIHSDVAPLANDRGEVEGGVVMQAEVELDVFSGEPNPAWRLSDTDTEILNEMLSELPLRSVAQLPENLGYRGFHVRMSDLSTGDIVELTVYGEVVRYSRKDDREYRLDPGRKVEAWLMEKSQPHINLDLYDYIHAELRTVTNLEKERTRHESQTL